MNDLEQIMSDRRFPCFFARAAFQDNELLYGLGDVATGLEPVLELFDAAVDAIEDNIEQTIILWLQGVPASSLAEEREFTREILDHLLLNDRVGWPAHAPTDPSHPQWDFWYGGVDFFINVSTPNHQHRRSRNLGSVYTLVIQSRTSFDIVEQRQGTARGMIRKRINRYDSLPVSPALGSHGDDAEIEQFFLDDSNEPVNQCPLTTQERIEQIHRPEQKAVGQCPIQHR